MGIAIATQALPKRYASATLIARGGMGEVYRATDSVLERKVAVKLLSERYGTEPEVRARFRREALAAARLSGAPHVITVFDVGEHRKRPFIVMEYVEGGSVHDRLREGRVPPEQALDWLEQAAKALDSAHAEGVVHRDVKPANLLVDRNGNICVTDFGIASTTGVDTLTLPGTVLGTAGYLSPEQARGEPATAASDRYGLAVVAFELLTGRRPFEADTAATEAFGHLNAPVPSAERLHPELPGRRRCRVRPGAGQGSRAASRDLRRARVGAPHRVLRRRGADDGRGRRGDRRADPRVSARSAPAPAHPAAPGRARSRPRRARAGRARGCAARRGRLGGCRPDGDDPTTTTTTTTPPSTTVPVDAAALNDAGFALMRAGDYASARPLLERAVKALRGSGTRLEGYALYNLAYTRFALGICGGVLRLLDRSEAAQGERVEINELYGVAYDRCVRGNSGEGGGDDD